MVKLLLPFIVILFFTSHLYSQQVTTASGGKALGTGGTLSFTVGQIDYTSFSGQSGELTLGVQQTYKNVAIEKNFQILLYPNPTSDNAILKIKNPASQDMQIVLYDLFGRVLQDRKISFGDTEIQLGGYRPATYILQVRIGQTVKTYKVIKTSHP